MVRLSVAIWLSVFALQAADVLTLVTPDSCTEDIDGSAADPCTDGCLRCVCCARVAAFVPQTAPALLGDFTVLTPVLPPLDPSTTASPRGIYHVPKHS